MEVFWFCILLGLIILLVMLGPVGWAALAGIAYVITGIGLFVNVYDADEDEEFPGWKAIFWPIFVLKSVSGSVPQVYKSFKRFCGKEFGRGGRR